MVYSCHMEPVLSPAAAPSSRTTPKDFFLWMGVLIALYGSIFSLTALLFDYIEYAFPDPVAGYADPYGGSIRMAMAAVIVLVPTLVVLLRIIRTGMQREAGKATIWVRRWVLGLTLFLATVTVLGDVITLITTYLGGELGVRFALKVLVVFLIAAGVFMHFMADIRGYWSTHPQRANVVGVGVVVLAVGALLSGFLIFGTPGHARLLRYDAQKVSDLQEIQSLVGGYWQQQHALPTQLSEITDSFSGRGIPEDTQPGDAYTYAAIGTTTFQLCATFNAPSPPAGETSSLYPAYP